MEIEKVEIIAECQFCFNKTRHILLIPINTTIKKYRICISCLDNWDQKILKAIKKEGK